MFSTETRLWAAAARPCWRYSGPHHDGPMRITTAFDSVEAIAVYRGWHALEQRIVQGVEIIDFDLVPEINDAVEFSNRAEVLQRLRRLRDQVAVAGSRQSPSIAPAIAKVSRWS